MVPPVFYYRVLRCDGSHPTSWTNGSEVDSIQVCEWCLLRSRCQRRNAEEDWGSQRCEATGPCIINYCHQIMLYDTLCWMEMSGQFFISSPVGMKMWSTHQPQVHGQANKNGGVSLGWGKHGGVGSAQDPQWGDSALAVPSYLQKLLLVLE